MRDEIFWGNLLGLLKTGKWTLNISEASALIQVVQEAEKRSRPPVLTPEIMSEPIKKDVAVSKPKDRKQKSADI